MTTSTARYRFEYRMFEWAEGYCRQMCGDRRSFFIGLRADASVRRIYFGRSGDPFDGERKAALAESHPSWLLYTPYGEVGSGYLEWYELERAVAERWLRCTFEKPDFMDVRSTGAREGWPRSWRAIVG